MDLDQALEAFGEIAIDARGRLFGTRPGRHESRTRGCGGPFADLGTLLDCPDPRHIDVRASITDPFNAIWVRRYRQTAAAKVMVIADCSGSMNARGRCDRRELLRVLCGGLALAVGRSGDLFGLILAGSGQEDRALLPPTRRHGLAWEAMALVEGTPLAGPGISALLAATELLPDRRSIVLLISDFADPVEELGPVLDRLSHHDVRPIVLRDSGLEDPEPRFGLVDLRDLETGRRRLVLMRQSLRDRWSAEAATHRAALLGMFLERGLEPIEIVDQIDVEALFEAFAGQRGTA